MEKEERYQLAKTRLADYNFKKAKAEKYLNIYKALPDLERFRGGQTLLKDRRTGLKDSSNSSKVYHSILALFDQTLQQAKEEIKKDLIEKILPHVNTYDFNREMVDIQDILQIINNIK